jgi:hypothetical protein
MGNWNWCRKIYCFLKWWWWWWWWHCIYVYWYEEWDLIKCPKNSSVAWVCEWIIPTEWPPLAGEVSANFLRIQGATWSAWRINILWCKILIVLISAFFLKLALF